MTLQADLALAVEVLRDGGIILYPTDTVWGLGCDATNSDAVRRIYGIKRRSDSKALITLVADEEMLNRHADVTPEVLNLVRSAQKPLTVIYGHARGLASNLLASDGSVGIRIPSDDYASRLCRLLGRPIVSTSANISGEPAAAVFGEISDEILGAVDYVASHRREDERKSPPSSIIKIGAGGEVIVLR